MRCSGCRIRASVRRASSSSPRSGRRRSCAGRGREPRSPIVRGVRPCTCALCHAVHGRSRHGSVAMRVAAGKGDRTLTCHHRPTCADPVRAGRATPPVNHGRPDPGMACLDIAWSWDRLLSWQAHYVHIEDYMDYVNEFFYRNAPSIPSLHDAAFLCLRREETLSSCAQGFTSDDVRLSNEIKEYARFILILNLESRATAACFMCIAEEADFMSELLACKTKNDVEEDVFITEVLDDDSLNFSNKVRRVAFDIMTTYKGPYSSRCIAATMLGIRKEANLLHDLLFLNPNHIDRFARLNVCESLRLRLLNYFIAIRDRRAPNATSSYTPITKNFPQLFTSEPCKESGNADETGFHITNDGVAVSNSTPTTTTTATPAAPISCSARVAVVDESDQGNTNNKSKSMGETQGSEVPSSQTSDANSNGNADEKRGGCRSAKWDGNSVECPLLPSDEQAEAIRPDGPNAGLEEKHMLEEATVMEGGSMKALVGLGQEIVALLKVLILAVLCALCIDVYVHCNR